MTKIVIDRKKWRCGANGKWKRGEGRSCLLNKEGFMCCLGMIINQLYPDTNILLKNTPASVEIDVPFLTDDNHNNTELAYLAIDINDDPFITNKNREKRLKKIFENVGIELEFINH